MTLNPEEQRAHFRQALLAQGYPQDFADKLWAEGLNDDEKQKVIGCLGKDHQRVTTKSVVASYQERQKAVVDEPEPEEPSTLEA